MDLETFAISSRFYRAYGTFQQPNPFAGFVAMIAAILLGILLVFSTDACRTWKRKESQSFLGALDRTSRRRCRHPDGRLDCIMVSRWVVGFWCCSPGDAVSNAYNLAPRVPRDCCPDAVQLVSLFDRLATAKYHGPVGGYSQHLFQFSDIRSVGITDVNFSLIERIAHWQSALNMWRSRFWFGVGLGGYESAYPLFMLPNWMLPLGHAHNIYLNMLAETGICGFECLWAFDGNYSGKIRACCACHLRVAARVSGWAYGCVGASDGSQSC